MLQIMEDMFDTLNYPQRYMEQRTFNTRPISRVAPAARSEGPGQRYLATFKLRVLFRQNATWAGTLAWTNVGANASFRSVLELIGIMDSALDCTDE